MPAQEEAYSNPVAPAGEGIQNDEPSKSLSGKLTNADFRRILMTPRVPAGASTKETTDSGGATKEKSGDDKKTQSERRDPKEEARANERKRKKSYYAKIRKEDEQKMAELAEKYRDRATERRDGINPDYQQEEGGTEGQGAYRAVAPDLKSGYDAAERRKQLIQQSKFLGGDMEHTHLVKGLDYALLQKVRSEITYKESAEAEAAAKGEEKETKREGAEQEEEQPKKKAPPLEEETPVRDEEKMAFKTSMGRRIFTTIVASRSPPEFNDLFLPGRMAYSIDLEADDEIPTTVIRSKADLQGIENMQATFTSNDLVIQKLSQILSYLRTGRTSKKIKKKELKKVEGTGTEESIYADIGTYTPAFVTGKGKETTNTNRSRDNRSNRDYDRRDNRRDRDGDRSKPRSSYFSKSGETEADSLRMRSRDEGGEGEKGKMGGWGSGKEREGVAAPPNTYIPTNVNQPQEGTKKKSDKKKKASEDSFYTECYPDMAEMHDAIDDSDDEADYTKMDLGNKKGPIGRWDFDTQEEYSDYMNQKEALPKAAFQYGVKMADGRKTRRIPGSTQKDRNAEASREWQQIQAILKKRKDGEQGGGGKRPKY